MDDTLVGVEIKPQLKPRGSVTKEKDPKPSHQPYKLQIKSTGSTRQTGCLWTHSPQIYRSLRAPTKEHELVLIAVDTGGKNTQEYLSSPHSRSRDQYRVGGHPREVRWTVTPSKGKDSDTDSSDSRKTFIILIF